jgi:hypothetical protein
MKKFLFPSAIILAFASAAWAQPRPMDKPAAKQAERTPLPSVIPVKYEGGMYGFSAKTEGTIKLDDANSRLVFFDKSGKELFGIPYQSFLVLYPQSKAVTSTTGNVVKWIPLPGAGLAGFIKEKRRYLIVEFDDPDVEVKGTINFKLDSKEILDSLLATLAEKAQLQQRGDAYYRPKNAKAST